MYLQNKIIQHTDNCLALQPSFELNRENNIIEKEATIFPGKYEKWVDGPYYDGPLKIYQFINCIMYLLFLGVVRTSRITIFEWINRTKNEIYSVMKYMYRGT